MNCFLNFILLFFLNYFQLYTQSQAKNDSIHSLNHYQFELIHYDGEVKSDFQKHLDSLSYKEKINSGLYPPYIHFTEEDKVQFPVEFFVELNIDEISDFDIKENKFYTKIWHSVFFKLDTLYVTKKNINGGEGYPTYWYPEDFVSLEYPESDRTYTTGYNIDEKFYSEFLKDTLNSYSTYSELELQHKWNLRDYPFDVQYLKYVFQSVADTSLVRLKPLKDRPPKLPKNFEYLVDGYNVVDVTTKNSIRETTIIAQYIEGMRPKVVERLEFLVSIDREGAYLYFKLFFGGFLSFLISFLVYFIKPEFFETRITLSLGGIFGSVGNKYFVENSMPSLQVLTKADIINNVVIIFIILNIFIVIGQHMKDINLGKFENNKFSAIIVFILFFIINFLIVKL